MSEDIKNIRQNKALDLQQYLFEKRKELQQYYDYFKKKKLINQGNVIELLEHSSAKYGYIDYSLTLIIFQELETLKYDDQQAYDFIVAISSIDEEINIYDARDKIQEFLYSKDPGSQISQGTKRKFLQTFELMHDAFEYNLNETHNLDNIATAYQFLEHIGYRIAYFRCKHLDIERMVNAMVAKFGK